ncbi:hypothetical protein DSL64_02910 [Dyadobacter luteus]|uniref:Uncharacterized protein n=1 Tax=Dyadobacter luteus TaxID=2259619 RepID=A0A3D8YFJ5_9BACT|nr:hypothetical protein DSL64_02910 [Dyadobacter luteus]
MLVYLSAPNFGKNTLNVLCIGSGPIRSSNLHFKFSKKKLSILLHQNDQRARTSRPDRIFQKCKVSNRMFLTKQMYLLRKLIIPNTIAKILAYKDSIEVRDPFIKHLCELKVLSKELKTKA